MVAWRELVRLTIDIPLVEIASLSLQLFHIFTYVHRFVTVSLSYNRGYQKRNEYV